MTSYIFLGLILALVAFLQIKKPDLTPARLAYADEINHPHLPHPHLEGHPHLPHAAPRRRGCAGTDRCLIRGLTRSGRGRRFCVVLIAVSAADRTLGA